MWSQKGCQLKDLLILVFVFALNIRIIVLVKWTYLHLLNEKKYIVLQQLTTQQQTNYQNTLEENDGIRV